MLAEIEDGGHSVIFLSDAFLMLLKMHLHPLALEFR